MQVSLNYVVLIGVKVLQVASQENAPSLRRCLRLGDEGLAIRLAPSLALIAKLLLKFAEFCWQEPGLREKFVVLRENSLHALQVPSEVILSSKGVHSREMIDPLIWLHPVQLVDLDRAIRPEQVPLIIRVGIVSHVRHATQAHFERITRHVAHYVVLGQ